MKTPHATEEEVRQVAEKLLGVVVSDLRAQIIEFRAEALRRDQAQDERLAQYLRAAKAANDQEKRTWDREHTVLKRLADQGNELQRLADLEKKRQRPANRENKR